MRTLANYDGSIRIDTKIDDTGFKQGTKSLASQAATLAAKYTKAGMTKSDAFKKAWSEIERTSKSGSKKVKKNLKGINKETGIVSKGFSKLGLAIAAVLSINVIGRFLKGISDLGTIAEASMNRVVDIFSEGSNAIDKFAQNNAAALGLSRKAVYEYASIYGNLFSAISKDAEENSRVTVAMLQASAVVASKTGRTMTDVMERIRSGLLGNTEAIEDLGINVNVAMLEMTDAFKRIADGQSWEKLTFYEQQQIRTLAILEQANRKFGDTVDENSSLVKAKFSAALENLKVTLGNLLNIALIPIINAFTTLFQLLDQFLIKVFGKATKSQLDFSKSSGKAAKGQKELAKETEKAGKAAKGSVAAFDDLNVLQSDTGGGGAAGGAEGGAGGGLGIGITEVATQAQELTTPFETIRKKLEEIGFAFVEFVNPNAENFTGIVENLGYIGESSFSLLKESAMTILESMTTDGQTIIQNMAMIYTNEFGVILQGVTTIFRLIYDTAIAPFIKVATQGFVEFLGLIADYWDKWGVRLNKSNTKALRAIFETIENIYTKFIQPVIETVLEALTWLWDNHFKDTVAALLEFLGVLGENFGVLMSDVIMPFISAIVDVLAPAWEVAIGTMGDIIKTVGGIISDVVTGALEVLGGLIKFITGVFTGDWEKAWEGVKDVFSGIFKVIEGIFKGVINAIITALNFLIRAINKIQFDVPDWVPGIGGESLGVNIPEIPMLAKGAVIQPNKPFMAMLGDQPSGLNIETPLATMLDAFNKALDSRGGGGGAGEVVLNLDGKELGRVTLPYIKGAEKERGVELVVGGAY